MVALVLQALLFQFGGLVVLGVNTVDVAVPALAAYLLFAAPIRRSSGRAAFVLAFLAGFLAVMLCALGVEIFLRGTDTNLSVIANTVFLAHIPFALIEGAITAFMVAYMKRAAPDLLMGVER